MRVQQLTPDHAIVAQAAFAYRRDEPAYAATLLEKAEEPLTAALELVGLLLQERAEALAEEAAR